MGNLSYWDEFDFVAGILYLIIAIILSLSLVRKRMFFFLLSIFHFTITIYYWSYSLTNIADSTMYYLTTKFTSKNWIALFGIDTYFIRFIIYPFVNVFNLNYLGLFFIFSIFGLLGFYYIFKIVLKIKPNVSNKILILLFLPQLHFWTCALGKDSLIFMQVSLLLYLWYSNKKIIYYILPLLIIGMVRIHILLFIIMGYGITIFFLDNKKISPFKKIFLVGVVFGLFVFLFPYLAERINVNSVSEVIEYADNESVKYSSGGGSSINLSSSIFPVKFISYLFRPLFFDVWSFLALEASIENLFWLYMFFNVSYAVLKNKNFFSQNRYKILMPYIVMMVIVLPLSYTLSNLGIAMRQKTMVFPLMFYLFIYYKSYKFKIKYE